MRRNSLDRRSNQVSVNVRLAVAPFTLTLFLPQCRTRAADEEYRTVSADQAVNHTFVCRACVGEPRPQKIERQRGWSVPALALRVGVGDSTWDAGS